jgi:hypothetical protein
LAAIRVVVEAVAEVAVVVVAAVEVAVVVSRLRSRNKLSQELPQQLNLLHLHHRLLRKLILRK